MNNTNPLAGDTLVLTGTSVTKAIAEYIQKLGGQAVHLPLIEVVERTAEDHEKFIASMDAEWLIFTSQSAVRFFKQKLIRYGYTAAHWHGKVAVVGEKTAAALSEIGFAIDFMPSIYSADVFIKEFQPAIVEKCVFFRGNLAKSTIPDGLNCDVECYTVYDTVQTARHMPALNELLTERVTIIFASPSAVEVFAAHKASKPYHVAAIGHITKTALENAGEMNIIMPHTYTMRAVIDELVKQKGTN